MCKTVFPHAKRKTQTSWYCACTTCSPLEDGGRKFWICNSAKCYEAHCKVMRKKVRDGVLAERRALREDI